MSLIYEAEADALRARDRAFTLDEARSAANEEADRKLRWMLTAVDDTYAPYLVKIHALVGSEATISFIDCTTGDVMEERLAIDLDDRELVWNRLPSTLDGWSPGTTDCAFLFLSSKIRDLTPSALASGGGEGKWPRGAAVTATFDEAHEVVRELLEAPELHARIAQLSEHKLRLLARLIGGNAS